MSDNKIIQTLYLKMVFSLITSIVSSYATVVLFLGGYVVTKKAMDIGKEKLDKDTLMRIMATEFADASKFPIVLYRHYIVPKTAPLVIPKGGE